MIASIRFLECQMERAYRRTDYLEQRRELMELWASHCRSGKERN